MIEHLLNNFLGIFTRRALKLAPAESTPSFSTLSSENSLLYIHIPFCETLCPYCSFHRYQYEAKTASLYCKALLKELQMYKSLGHDFSAMYIGGGTPTVIGGKLIEIIDSAVKNFKIKEVSVETNPDFLDEHNLLLLRDAGVNRLSVGVQSFDDRILKSIGRLEKYGGSTEISEKISRAMGIFNTLNIDLIFNFPHQSMESLDKDLDHIDKLLPDQVTFYPLMRSNYTRNTMTKQFGRIDYKKEKEFYFKILEIIKRKYTHSTAWCFSRNSSMIDEYVVHYDNYIGAGSGAFGYTSGKIFVNTFSIKDYISMINNNMLPIWGTKTFSERQTVYYYVLMKLFGMSLNKDEFKACFKKTPDRKLFPEMLLLKTIRAVKENHSELKLTEKGSYLWVIAMREFFKAVDNLRDQCRNTLKE